MEKVRKDILNILKESEENQEKAGGLTIAQYAKFVCGGEMDCDVCDKDIDMLVAMVYDVNHESSDEMSKFLDILANNVKIVKAHPSSYGDVLECDFSSFFKPYNEQLKEFFDMSRSEFDDEAYYEAVVNLEPLISGNASEQTYKELNNILTNKQSKPEVSQNDSGDNMNESTQKMSYDEFLNSEWLKDYLKIEFKTSGYNEWSEFINNFDKDNVKSVRDDNLKDYYKDYLRESEDAARDLGIEPGSDEEATLNSLYDEKKIEWTDLAGSDQTAVEHFLSIFGRDFTGKSWNDVESDIRSACHDIGYANEELIDNGYWIDGDVVPEPNEKLVTDYIFQNYFLPKEKPENINESTDLTAEVIYHDEDGTRDYVAGKLSDGRYFLIGQQEQILVSNKDLPSLAKKDMDDFSYDEDGDKEFIEALENGTTLDKNSDLAKVIINASRKYLEDGCYLLSESEDAARDLGIELGSDEEVRSLASDKLGLKDIAKYEE